ncbi:MAG: hemerythrin domain-containing protein [Nitrososphaeraceae archaeon]
MISSNRIDFDEPIQEMITRLESEHKEFESNLEKVKINIQDKNITLASEIIQSISGKIVHHAVEEEARLMRVIMQKAKQDSAQSVKIVQEHNWVMNFLKNRIITVEKVSASSDRGEYEQAKNDLNEFISNLRKNFKEEEEIVFPLALRAEAAD